MKDAVSIITPDHIELEFELAGPGSRLMAYILDALLMTCVLVALVIAAVSIVGVSNISPDQLTTSVGLAVFLVLAFLVQWGYFAFFEWRMGGRTPGKKTLKLRVIRDDGLPAGWREIFTRNLVRAADMLPLSTYMLGGLVALLNPRGKRLGDMAAGTIVVFEGFDSAVLAEKAELGARWMLKIESGASSAAVVLPGGRLKAEQLAVVEQFVARRGDLPEERRGEIAWRIAQWLLPLTNEDPAAWERRPDREEACIGLMNEVLNLARRHREHRPEEKGTDEEAVRKKKTEWIKFGEDIKRLLRRRKSSLAAFSPSEIKDLFARYRAITSDLARARSLGGDAATIRFLNSLAVAGHNLLYSAIPAERALGAASWPLLFSSTVRKRMGHVMVSAALLFIPGVVAFLAVQWHPQVGYDILPANVEEFRPAREESMHDIPEVARPLAASGIITNNLQVTLTAFGLGLTAGLGTTYVLVMNGVHIGGMAGWFAARGQTAPFWGWVMPHGLTELLAIVLSGAAGLLLAEAIVAPGQRTRLEALKLAGRDALVIELGCLAMLVIAGMIEGFVSPSRLSLSGRIAMVALSGVIWIAYFSLPGRRLENDSRS